MSGLSWLLPVVPPGPTAQRPQQNLCSQVLEEEAHRGHATARAHLLREIHHDVGAVSLHRQVPIRLPRGRDSLCLPSPLVDCTGRSVVPSTST